MIFNMVGGGGGSSTKSTIIVSIDTGSTVAAYSDSGYTTLVKTATEKSSGEFWLTGLDNGTYYIKATLNGDEATASYTISEYGVYRIGMAYRTVPEFTYTGNYELVDDSDQDISNALNTANWKIRFLTSGTLSFSTLYGAEDGIDVFLVGGGGQGGGDAGGGGGAGKTATHSGISVQTGTSYSIVVGAGGYNSTWSANPAGAGGSSSAFTFSVDGGTGGSPYNKNYGGYGGSGGSKSRSSTSYGGSDGNDGYGSDSSHGYGQGTTTREFGGYSNTIASAVSSSTTFTLGSEPTETEKTFLVNGKYLSVGASRECYPIVSYDNSTRKVTVSQNNKGNTVTAAQGDAVLFGNLYAGGGTAFYGSGSSLNADSAGYGGGGTPDTAPTDNTGSGSGGAYNGSKGAKAGATGIVIIRNARS